MTTLRRVPAPKPMAYSGKVILVLVMSAVATSGLFPPWLYTIYATGTRGEVGYHSEKSAGCHFLLTPPPPEIDHAACGIKLDGERLLIEWACIIAVGVAAWAIVGMSRRRASEAVQEEVPECPEAKAKISGEAKALVHSASSS